MCSRTPGPPPPLRVLRSVTYARGKHPRSDDRAAARRNGPARTALRLTVRRAAAAAEHDHDGKNGSRASSRGRREGGHRVRGGRAGMGARREAGREVRGRGRPERRVRGRRRRRGQHGRGDDGIALVLPAKMSNWPWRCLWPRTYCYPMAGREAIGDGHASFFNRWSCLMDHTATRARASPRPQPRRLECAPGVLIVADNRAAHIVEDREITTGSRSRQSGSTTSSRCCGWRAYATPISRATRTRVKTCRPRSSPMPTRRRSARYSPTR